MDTDKIVQALNYTVNPADQGQIKQAEQFFELSKTQPAFAPALMLIASQKDQPLPLRQAAIVQLKQLVERHWSENPKRFTITAEDKQTVKDNLLEAIINSVDEAKIAVNYEKILSKIADFEFPAKWPGFLEQVLGKLASGQSFNELYGALLIIKNLVGNYEFITDEDRKPLNEIVPLAFPLVEKCLASIVANPCEKDNIKVILQSLKTFYYACHLELPAYFQDPAVLNNWMAIFKQILEFEGTFSLDGQKDLIGSAKKWTGRALQRFIQKYGNPKFAAKGSEGFAALWLENYSVGFLEIFTKVLMSAKNQPNPKVVHYALKYLFYSLRIEKTCEVLKPFLREMLTEILVPMLYFTQQDEETYRNDPEEFVRKEEDFTSILTNNKNTAMDLIEAISKLNDKETNETYLRGFVKHAIEAMTNPSGADAIFKKEALLWAIGVLREKILDDELLKNSVEDMLQKFVLNEFSSSVGILRARACWVFGKYGHISFNNQENVKVAVEGITSCLLDGDLPVRVKAAVSLNCLLSQKQAIDLLKPSLPKILEIYLKIMEQIDNEGIVSSLEGIVDSFKEEICPYAVQLSQHLANAFHLYVAKEKKREENDEDLTITPASCLEAVGKILSTKLPTNVVQEITGIILPLVNYCLSFEGGDYIEEGLNILNLCLFKSEAVDQRLWSYFPILVYIITGIPETADLQAALNGASEEERKLLEDVKEGWGAEFIDNMLGCFKNFLQKGGSHFLTLKDWTGTSFLELLFRMIEKITQVGFNGQDQTDMVAAGSLYIVILENSVGKEPEILEEIVKRCLILLPNLAKKKQAKAVYMATIAVALHIDTKRTLEALHNNNAISFYLDLLVSGQKLLKNELDMMCVVYGISSLLRFNNGVLPAEVVGKLQSLMKVNVGLVGQILELRQEEDESDEELDEVEEQAQINKTLNQLEGFRTGNNDDLDDADLISDFGDMDVGHSAYYSSPLEEGDEVVFFEDSLKQLASGNNELYAQLAKGLSEKEQANLQENFRLAREDYEEYLKTKDQE